MCCAGNYTSGNYKGNTSEHKMSGTVRACVREPSQTTNLPFFFFFLKKKKSSTTFLLTERITAETMEVPISQQFQLHHQSIPLCVLGWEKKNGHTCKLTQNVKALNGRDSQSKNLPDLGLVSRETKQFKKQTSQSYLSSALCAAWKSPHLISLSSPLSPSCHLWEPI